MLFRSILLIFQGKNEGELVNYVRLGANEGEAIAAIHEKIQTFIKLKSENKKEWDTASEMKTFQRYLSSINKRSMVQ